MSEEIADIDPVETQEWLDALASVVKHEGKDRAEYLLTELNKFAQQAGSNAPTGMTAAYANTIAMLNEKNSKQAPLNFASITAPTLLMWGEKDIWVPAALSEQWLANISSSTLITYPDAGHVPMEENPTIN